MYFVCFRNMNPNIHIDRSGNKPPLILGRPGNNNERKFLIDYLIIN